MYENAFQSSRTWPKKIRAFFSSRSMSLKVVLLRVYAMCWTFLLFFKASLELKFWNCL